MFLYFLQLLLILFSKKYHTRKFKTKKKRKRNWTTTVTKNQTETNGGRELGPDIAPEQGTQAQTHTAGHQAQGQTVDTRPFEQYPPCGIVLVLVLVLLIYSISESIVQCPSSWGNKK